MTLTTMTKKKYLIALPSLRGTKGFNCPTILVSAINELDAISIVYSIKGNNITIGEIKEVDY